MSDAGKFRDENYFSHTEPALLSISPRSSQVYNEADALRKRLSRDISYRLLICLALFFAFLEGAGFGRVFVEIRPMVGLVATLLCIALGYVAFKRALNLGIMIPVIMVVNLWGAVPAPNLVPYDPYLAAAAIFLQFCLLASALVRRAIISGQVVSTANFYRHPLCFVPRLDRATDQPFESNVR